MYGKTDSVSQLMFLKCKWQRLAECTAHFNEIVHLPLKLFFWRRIPVLPIRLWALVILSQWPITVWTPAWLLKKREREKAFWKTVRLLYFILELFPINSELVEMSMYNSVVHWFFFKKKSISKLVPMLTWILGKLTVISNWRYTSECRWGIMLCTART